MADATNGQTVTKGDAGEALEKRREYQHSTLEQYGALHHALTTAQFLLSAMHDENAHEYDEDFMDFLRLNNPAARSRTVEHVESMLDLLTAYVAEEYPDAVVWTIDRESRGEVDP